MAQQPKPKRIITDPITNLKAHVDFLGKPSPRDPTRDGYDIEFKYLEDQSRKEEQSQSSTTANLAENNEKNRYTNVKPPDFSRVPLSLIPGVPGSNYINANFVKGHDGQPTVYISAQGPLEHTLNDFWRMVWEHKLCVVLMLTKEVEGGKMKSARYWPEMNNNTPTSQDHGRLRITIVSRTDQKDIIIRNMTVENLDASPPEKRDVVHLQYTGWLDHQAPPSVKSFMNMLHLVDDLNAKAKSSTTNLPAPICVHCSAGIGRSGTFCGIHLLYNFMKKHFETSYSTPPINVVNTILEMRRQRPGMVQTKEQYVFIYSVIYDEFKKMKKEAEKKLKGTNGSQPPPSAPNSTTAIDTKETTTTTTTATTTTTTTTTTPLTATSTPSHNGQSEGAHPEANRLGIEAVSSTATPVTVGSDD